MLVGGRKYGENVEFFPKKRAPISRSSYHKGRKRAGLHYAFVATLTSSIFLRTVPFSIAAIALSKPSLMLAAFLLM